MIATDPYISGYIQPVDICEWSIAMFLDSY